MALGNKNDKVFYISPHIYIIIMKQVIHILRQSFLLELLYAIFVLNMCKNQGKKCKNFVVTFTIFYTAALLFWSFEIAENQRVLVQLKKLFSKKKLCNKSGFCDERLEESFSLLQNQIKTL